MSQLFCIEGTEYAGKTETAKLLAQTLTENSFIARYNTGVIYPSSSTQFIDELAKNLGKRKKELLYTIAYMLDKTAQMQNNSNEIIIQDRYWQSVVSYGRFFNGKNSIHKNLDLIGLFLQPDVTIYLECSFEERMNRRNKRPKKTEIDNYFMKNPGELNRLEKEVKLLLSKLSNVITIDTTFKPPAQVVEEAKDFLKLEELL